MREIEIKSQMLHALPLALTLFRAVCASEVGVYWESVGTGQARSIFGLCAGPGQERAWLTQPAFYTLAIWSTCHVEPITLPTFVRAPDSAVAIHLRRT